MSPGRRLAVVTGGNKGIGYYIAAQLLAAGHDVIIGCRSAERGEAAAAALGAGCTAARLDISDSSSIAQFVEAMHTQHPALHVLVNNAGIAFKSSDTTPFAKQTRTTLRTNYEGTVEITAALLPLLRKADNPRIVSVASMAGKLKQLSPELQHAFASESLTLPKLNELVAQFEADVDAGKHRERGWSNSNYGLSKLAVIAFTKVLARDESSILVNACCPGYCDTDMTSHNGPRPAEVGARTAVALALLPSGSSVTGQFWENEQPSTW
ncbi:hypothetical protein KFE25_009242 [Diacronema lutheri]|uniref:Carbonyl reductase n=1 Tax=Diacronema lutheri TaxID=2081491 RepID=A0A8J5XXF4_DIALT|nr:hypothetical protein KFE25_009242 [Diacronema lutheri]